MERFPNKPPDFATIWYNQLVFLRHSCIYYPTGIVNIKENTLLSVYLQNYDDPILAVCFKKEKDNYILYPLQALN